MRHEYAVSEIIGAVILIGVVMAGMGLLVVLLLSTPPPEETPKASISSYCVRCDLKNNYEIIMYHGGGESLERDKLQFYLHTKDGKMEKMDEPDWVYEGNPEDCMFTNIGSSSLSGRENWTTSSNWESGETLRFMFHSLSEPTIMDTRYYPFKSSMSRAEFTDEIRDSMCVKENRPDECNDPTGELIPILVNTTCDPDGCSGDKCTAYFTYFTTSDYVPIPAHDSGKPWNNFIGTSSTVPPVIFTKDNSYTEIIPVKFSKSVYWRLNRSKSAKASCE